MEYFEFLEAILCQTKKYKFKKKCFWKRNTNSKNISGNDLQTQKILQKNKCKFKKISENELKEDPNY